MKFMFTKYEKDIVEADVEGLLKLFDMSFEDFQKDVASFKTIAVPKRIFKYGNTETANQISIADLLDNKETFSLWYLLTSNI